MVEAQEQFIWLEKMENYTTESINPKRSRSRWAQYTHNLIKSQGLSTRLKGVVDPKKKKKRNTFFSLTLRNNLKTNRRTESD